MSDFKKWYADIGSKVDKEVSFTHEQYSHLVWNAALASMLNTAIIPCGDCGIPMHLGIICHNPECVRNLMGGKKWAI